MTAHLGLFPPRLFPPIEDVAATPCQAAAQSGLFPKALLPGLSKVSGTLADMLTDGSMLRHATTTLMLAGFAPAVGIGIPLGILMGRMRGWKGAASERPDADPWSSATADINSWLC